MASSTDAIWASTSFLVVGAFMTTHLPYHILRDPKKFLSLSALLIVLLLSKFWQSQVTRIVPEPYLDEIFHIPQAQAYCKAQYQTWDPKLTTPPGLYAFTILFLKFTRGVCDVGSLRLFNVFALLITTIYALDIRTRLLHVLNSRKSSTITTEGIHTAVNIALFPPLFFFSGLYYTDVLSTCFVLMAYKSFLERKGLHDNSGKGLYMNYVLGILALTMRQTNIFWVAVFLGGAEAVRAVKSNAILAGVDENEGNDTAMAVVRRWAIGDVHDAALEDAGLIGDKSNHIATIHLPQLLYIFPFIVFFSFPLIIPPTLTHTLNSIRNILSPPPPPPPSTQTSQELPRELFYILTFITTMTALIGTIAIIHFNTIIHPFTLADNRHYIFYIFRYTILRHPLIRYVLAPIYLACSWVVYLSLCPTKPTTTSTINPNGNTTSTIILLLIPTILSLITAPLVEPRYFIIPSVLYLLHLPKNQSHKYLFVQTIWFLLINMGTGYMFLYRGFEWPQEPGLMQRFMW